MPEAIARTIAPGVHTVDVPLRFGGIEVGARMTVLSTRDGLLLHSPVDVPPSAIAALGEPRWALAPNKLHHLWAGQWAAAGIETWGAVGLPEKRADIRFAGVVAPGDASPFGRDVEVLAIRSLPFTNEVVVLHRPSKTLVVTDLLFNIGADAPWSTRFVMRCLGAHPGCRASLLERVAMRRDLARKELRTMAHWDFDRVIMSHGEVVETDAKQALRDAYRWLER